MTKRITISQERNKKEKIIRMTIRDHIKSLGTGAYISVPRELIGARVQIKLEVIDEKATDTAGM